MGCHALGEDVDDDDGGKFLEAALKDDALAAYLLLCLSRPPRSCAPSPPPSYTSAGAEDADHPPDRPNWGTRKRRVRCAAAKEEDARRPSPVTPLSRSGGSSTSGSVSESACPPNRQRLQPPDGAPGNGAEPGSNLPVPATPPSENRVLAVAAEMAAAGSSVGSGSNKVAEVRGPPWPAAARIEPLRLRLTGDATNTAGVRRPAKKKTLPELKALTESLLQEQLQLKKELDAQRNLFAALLEENGRLKSLEQSMRQAPAKSVACEALGSEPAAEEDRADPPKRRRMALLDLNCPPPAADLLLF